VLGDGVVGEMSQSKLSHAELCLRALRWLRGTRRCHPVFGDVASCEEIPDAIGWTSCFRWRGSTVVECKTSVSDFYADKMKVVGFEHPTDGDYQLRGRLGRRTARELGYREITLPRMGDFRFYMSEPGVLTPKLIENHAPDHGLLHVVGRKILIVREAIRREIVDHQTEVRYLRFAIVNNKKPYELPKGADMNANLLAISGAV